MTLLSVWCATLQFVIMMKLLLLPLCFFFASLTGACPQTDVNVTAGEMVALYCCGDRGNNHGDAEVIWRSYNTQEVNLTTMSSAEQTQMGLLVHGRSLVILNASAKHQGNYSCSQGNAGSWSWFRLTVYTEYEKVSSYPQTCYAQEACTLCCPEVNVPARSILNITSNGIKWLKEGKSKPGYFSRVKENDQGAYTCTRSYLYNSQLYNMTFTLLLDVKPKEKPKHASITKPNEGDQFPVDLGSPKVIDCEAVVYSDFDDVFWFSGESFVETNNSYPVFYNTTWGNNAGEIKMTASLVFKKVSEEDLSKNYTCQLQTVSGHSSSVTITLAQKTRPSYVFLAVAITIIVVAMSLTVLIYVRFKIDITLFLRDTLGCHSSTSDGKSYDAFLMCYKSDTDAGLNAHDRKWLESVLEEKFGYSLCLYDRDVLPGKAVAEAVLDSIEQSRTMVLIPTSPDPGPGSGLLSAIHAALVERQTHLVFIKTEATEVPKSGSLSEALQLLSEAGDCVSWKDESSMRSSSSFWKQLRYYLPAPQRAPRICLSPQTI